MPRRASLASGRVVQCVANPVTLTAPSVELAARLMPRKDCRGSAMRRRRHVSHGVAEPYAGSCLGLAPFTSSPDLSNRRLSSSLLSTRWAPPPRSSGGGFHGQHCGTPQGTGLALGSTQVLFWLAIFVLSRQAGLPLCGGAFGGGGSDASLGAASSFASAERDGKIARRQNKPLEGSMKIFRSFPACFSPLLFTRLRP